MSDSFKAHPKSILCHNDAEFDPDRVDRFGHNFKYLEQHISFKDKVLEEPLETIIMIEQVEPVELDKSEDKTTEKFSEKEVENETVGLPKKSKKIKAKHCDCAIQ